MRMRTWSLLFISMLLARSVRAQECTPAAPDKSDTAKQCRAWPAMPPVLVREIADTATMDRYLDADSLSWFGADLRILTPVGNAVRRRMFDAWARRNRRRVMGLAAPGEDRRYHAIPTEWLWARAVGDRHAAVVTVAVVPRIEGISTLGVVGLMLTPSVPQTPSYGLVTDPVEVVVFRYSLVVPPLRTVTGQVQSVRRTRRRTELEDSTHFVAVVLPIEIFEPGPDGVPPTIVIGFRDARSHHRLFCDVIPRDAIALRWNEFLPWFAQTGRSALMAEPQGGARPAPTLPPDCYRSDSR